MAEEDLKRSLSEEISRLQSKINQKTKFILVSEKRNPIFDRRKYQEVENIPDPEDIKKLHEYKALLEKMGGYEGEPESLVKYETVECHSCRGTGVVKCDRCNGTGIVTDYVEGLIFDHAKKETCFSCHGSGKRECYTCNGIGKIERIKR